MGRSMDEDIKERAFQLWRKNGRSPDKTVKTLRDAGHLVSRQTIDAWKNERGWEERAAKADAAEQEARDPELSGEERMVAALAAQAKRYEDYFEALTPKTMDTQAVYAYTNLITTLQNIRQKTGAFKAELFVDFMKELISWLSKNDPAAVAALEANLDEFIAYARETYGKR